MTQSRRSYGSALLALALAALLAGPALATVTVYEEGDKKVEIGVGMQFQYHLVDPDTGEETDDFNARRLRPDFRGTVSPGWDGRLFLEVGSASDDNEVRVLDAWMRHKSKAMNVTLGSRKPAFSREWLTSIWTQQTIERSFVGSPNYGTPDRSVGIFLDGRTPSKVLSWAVGGGSLAFDPNAGRVAFRNPVNKESDFNQGWVTAARLEVHPRGPAPYAQGDLDRGPFLYTLAAGAFTWGNDDDNNTYTDADGRSTSATRADLDTAQGFEVSLGLRGGGLSLDAEVQRIDADTVDPAFTGGLYRDGTAELDKMAVEVGIMLAANRLELVGGYQSLDAEAYAEAWTRSDVGFNLFWNQHKAKLQFLYRLGESLNGVQGNDADEIYLQFQYLF